MMDKDLKATIVIDPVTGERLTLERYLGDLAGEFSDISKGITEHLGKLTDIRQRLIDARLAGNWEVVELITNDLEYLINCQGIDK